MEREEFSPTGGICLLFAAAAAHKRFLCNKKWSEPVCFNQILRDLAWKLITKGQNECWAAIPLHEDSRPLTSSRLPMASFPGRGLGSVKITPALTAGKPNWLRHPTLFAFHDAVIRVCDEAGNVIETREHKGDFKSGDVSPQGTKETASLQTLRRFSSVKKFFGSIAARLLGRLFEGDRCLCVFNESFEPLIVAQRIPKR
jgi:hypothetical protein